MSAMADKPLTYVERSELVRLRKEVLVGKPATLRRLASLEARENIPKPQAAPKVFTKPREPDNKIVPDIFGDLTKSQALLGLRQYMGVKEYSPAFGLLFEE
jgi:hypothetical protein